MIQAALDELPVVAILRGVQPHEVVEIAETLFEHGVRCIEVPLNSPSPLESIEKLASAMPDECVVGAGTVIASESVRQVRDAGGRLIVSPNTSRRVIQTAVAFDMPVMPGVATPTEAFAAVKFGARYLKLFPASTYGTAHVKAMLAVLPKNVRILAVGGIGEADVGEWLKAGVVGFGIGGELYRAGDSVAVVQEKIQAFKKAL